MPARLLALLVSAVGRKGTATLKSLLEDNNVKTIRSPRKVLTASHWGRPLLAIET